MTQANNDHHDRKDPASVGDDHALVLDVLKRALDAEDTGTKNYSVREALQLLHIDNREEIVQLLEKGLDAEDADTMDVCIREAIELLDIENTVASATQTNSDKTAK